MYIVYILKSKVSGRYYIGSTSNLDRRIFEHNNSKANRFTKSERPWKVVYTEAFETRSEAMTRERQIKAWKKRAAVEKLIKIGPFV